MSSNNMSSRSQNKTGGKRDNRGARGRSGGRGRGRGRGRGGGRRYNNRRYNNKAPIRKVPEKPMTPMEKLRATNMPAYVRIVQAKRINEMEEKYIEDKFVEKPKIPYIPRAFTRNSGTKDADSVSRELAGDGWNYQDGEFLHPYTTAKIHKKVRKTCSDGVISLPMYDSYMDEKGVSSNIMNSDNMPVYFSENTYVCESCPGSMAYNIKQHKFKDFWDTRRGKRTLIKYAYQENRRKKKEMYNNMKKQEQKGLEDYQNAKRRLRS